MIREIRALAWEEVLVPVIINLTRPLRRPSNYPPLIPITTPIPTASHIRILSCARSMSFVASARRYSYVSGAGCVRRKVINGRGVDSRPSIGDQPEKPSATNLVCSWACFYEAGPIARVTIHALERNGGVQTVQRISIYLRLIQLKTTKG